MENPSTPPREKPKSTTSTPNSAEKIKQLTPSKNEKVPVEQRLCDQIISDGF
jgi:hypothetical protein